MLQGRRVFHCNTMFFGKNQRVGGARRSWPMSFGFLHFFSFVNSINIAAK
jgi:hypothetical protein